MATSTEFITGLATTMSLNGVATIDAGETESLAIPNSGRAVVRLGFPAMTGTTVSFTAQAYPKSGEVAAAEFRPVVDKDGAAVTYTVTDDSLVAIPELSGCAAFTIVSGSAEASARAIEVSSRGDNPLVTPTEIEVNIESGATLTANQGTAAAASGAWPVYEVPQSIVGAASSIYNPLSNGGAAASIKGTPGNVLHFIVTNQNAAVRYLQFHNKASAPSNGEAPQISFPIPAGTATAPGYVELTLRAAAFTTGIAFVVSTTQATMTGATASEHDTLVEYK